MTLKNVGMKACGATACSKMFNKRLLDGSHDPLIPNSSPKGWGLGDKAAQTLYLEDTPNLNSQPQCCGRATKTAPQVLDPKPRSSDPRSEHLWKCHQSIPPPLQQPPNDWDEITLRGSVSQQRAAIHSFCQRLGARTKCGSCLEKVMGEPTCPTTSPNKAKLRKTIFLPEDCGNYKCFPSCVGYGLCKRRQCSRTGSKSLQTQKRSIAGLFCRGAVQMLKRLHYACNVELGMGLLKVFKTCRLLHPGALARLRLRLMSWLSFGLQPAVPKQFVACRLCAPIAIHLSGTRRPIEDRTSSFQECILFV